MFKIGITGYMGAGKSTFADYLEAALDGRVQRLPFAQPMKKFIESALQCDPWTQAGKQMIVPAAGLTVRQILQGLGAGVRHEMPDFWVWSWKTAIDVEADYIIADDVRYLNEARECDLMFYVSRHGCHYGDHESERLDWIGSMAHRSIYNFSDLIAVRLNAEFEARRIITDRRTS